VDQIIEPEVKTAGHAFLSHLDTVNVEDLCQRAEEQRAFGGTSSAVDFTI
jgi:hypothetical protein